MKLRHSYSILAGVAAMASAQVVPTSRVPVLSEPRSMPLWAISYDAWGDTLIAARMGTTYRIVRKGDEVVLLDSLVSDSLQSEMPHTFPQGNGTHLQVSKDWLATLDWKTGSAAVSLRGIDMGYARAEGDLFRFSTLDTLYGFLCSSSNAFLVKRPDGGAWTLDTRLPVGANNVQHCAVDPTTGTAVRFFHAQGADSSQMQTGDARKLLGRAGVQRLPIKPTTVFAEPFGWLAYDDSTGKIITYYDPGWDGPVVNRTFFPTELANLKDTYVRPVRKDSLLVFGGDSTLVLAGWTRGQILVYQTIKLDSKIGYAMALGDSVLWVHAGNNVLSFRYGWKDRALTGIQPRTTRLSQSSLRIHQYGQSLITTWKGSESTPIQLLGSDGSLLAQKVIGPNESAEFPLPKHKGMMLIRTVSGSQPFMVR